MEDSYLHIYYDITAMWGRGSGKNNRIDGWDPNFEKGSNRMGIAGGRWGCIREYFDIGGQQ